MDVIINFNDKRLEHEGYIERKILKFISIHTLHKNISLSFAMFFHNNCIDSSIVQDGCVESGIDAFVLGVKCSRLSLFEDPVDVMEKRSKRDVVNLINSLHHFLLTWGLAKEIEGIEESLLFACQEYIQNAWLYGFDLGRKKRKLRQL
ncbi:DUF2521 family protein [Bacillus carboniphilus]|uniref:DUF2521 family protein n=1 Tax=Bacillus carboniphilus TaxID=86663 RepID=A0ABY9JUN9_9BACI|nr:DUF2521 family protein [Bacillus carboniphilus]WLR42018.1 DUF2521 family protein [Bacillus carboniphilus]